MTLFSIENVYPTGDHRNKYWEGRWDIVSKDVNGKKIVHMTNVTGTLEEALELTKGHPDSYPISVPEVGD